MHHLLTLALGAVTVLGFAPCYWWPIPILTLSLLPWLLRDATPMRAAGLGYCLGLGMFGTGVSWVYISLHTFGDMPAALAALATLLFCAFLALFPALALWLTARLDTRFDWLTLPMAWLVTEWVRGWIFTGFPWLAVGYAQIPDSPLAGWAPVIGIYGSGAVGMMCSVLLSKVWSAINIQQRLSWLAVAALPFVMGLMADLVSNELTQSEGRPLPVSLLQGNIQQDLKWNPTNIEKSLSTYAALTQHSQGQLVVQPETAIPLLAQRVPAEYWQALRQSVEARQADILIGLPQYDGENFYNAVISLGRSPQQVYRKSHLVPFGEYIPTGFQWILRWLHIPMGNFGRGSSDQAPLQVAGQRVAVNICYEDAFGEEIIRSLPAATLLVNVSNDAWFGHSLAPRQHLQMAQARALETGRPLLRATNTGMTAIIDHRGHIQGELKPFEAGVLEGKVQGRSGRTLYTYWGNSLCVTLAFLILTAVGARKFISGFRSRA